MSKFDDVLDDFNELYLTRQENAETDVTTKIESILDEMEMSQQDLKEMLETILGVGKAGAEIEDETISISQEEVEEEYQEHLDEVYSIQMLEEMMIQASCISQLKKLVLMGKEMKQQEIAQILNLNQSQTIDIETLEQVEINDNGLEASRDKLKPESLKTLFKAVLARGVALNINSMLSNSGSAASDVLRNIKDRINGSQDKWELEKVYIEDGELHADINPKQKDVGGQKLQKDLIRIDHQMDMKLLMRTRQEAKNAEKAAQKGNDNTQLQRMQRGKEQQKPKEKLQERTAENNIAQKQGNILQNQEDQRKRTTVIQTTSSVRSKQQSEQKQDIKEQREEAKEQKQDLEQVEDKEEAKEESQNKKKSSFVAKVLNKLTKGKIGGEGEQLNKDAEGGSESSEEKEPVKYEQEAKPKDKTKEKKEETQSQSKDLQNRLNKLDAQSDMKRAMTERKADVNKAKEILENAPHKASKEAMQKASDMKKMGSIKDVQQAAKTAAHQVTDGLKNTTGDKVSVKQTPEQAAATAKNKPGHQI